MILYRSRTEHVFNKQQSCIHCNEDNFERAWCSVATFNYKQYIIEYFFNLGYKLENKFLMSRISESSRFVILFL